MKHHILTMLALLLLAGWQQQARAEAGDVLFQESFDTQAGFNRFTVLDLNHDGDTWLWGASKGGFSENNFWATYLYSSSKQGNDWLLTPELQLQEGTIYNLQFRMKPAGSNYYTEVIAIAFGQGDDPTKYQLLQDEMLVPIGDWRDFSYQATVTATGSYRFGFQALSPADQYAIYIDDVVVAELGSAATPAPVGSLTATPGEEGALQATLSFTLPSRQSDGQELKGDLEKVTIERDGQLIATLTEGLQPGSQATYTDAKATIGNHTYIVRAFSAMGGGLPATTEVYVGEDVPSVVTHVELVDHIDHYTLSWQAPTRGENGHYFNPQNVTYSVYLPNGYQADILLAQGITATSLDIDAIDGEQTLARFRIKAVNKAGESDFQNSNVIVVGDPYQLPITESFAGGKTNTDHYWWLDAAAYYGNYWHVNTTGSSDGDGGCFVWVPYDYYDEAWLNSGKIDLRQTVNPKLTFDFNIKRNSTARIQIEAVDNLQQTTIVGYVDGKTADKTGWAQAEFSLAELRNLPYVMLKFHSTADDDESQELLAIDNIKMLDVVDHNLAATLLAPKSTVAGKLTTVPVTVHNFGQTTEQDYHVLLYADDVLVADSACTKALAPLTDATVALQFTPQGGNAQILLWAEVVLEADEVAADNRTKTEVLQLVAIDVKTVEQLTAANAAEGIALSWQKPELKAETVTDDFESYPAWSTENVGEWRMADLDDAWSLGLGNYTFPEMEEAYAYIVFNRNQLQISPYAEEGTAPGSEIPWIEAHSGEQYMAAFAPKEDMGVATADDWLISPQLNGEAQTISFWAKSLAKNGWEHYEVLYSMTDTRVDNFLVAKAESLIETTTWTQFEAQIPAGALYFAIRHLTPTDLGYGIFIDDVTFTRGDGELLAYNVYRDGKLVTTLGPDATTWTDAEGTPGSRYQLSCLYRAGESPLSEAVSISTGIGTVASATAQGVAATYRIDGVRTLGGAWHGISIQQMKDGSVRKQLKF